MRWFAVIDTVVATAHTWVWALNGLMAGAAWLSAWIEGLPPYGIILVVCGVLALSLVITYHGLLLFELVRGRMTVHRDQTRIAQTLKEYSDAGMPEIDTLTAASIWANSNDPNDLTRHLRFRHIKAAIAAGEIKGARQVGPSKGPNIYTRIRVDELRDYFSKTGVFKS